MRKVSYNLKQYFLRRRKKIERKRSVRIPNIKTSQIIRLKTPEILNLSDNFEESVEFFSQIRNISNQKFTHFNINFKTLKEISASAALVLAAEMDRIKHIRGGRKGFKVLDFNKWDNDIKILLRDMGMYKLLNIANIKESFLHLPSAAEERFMKFQTGDKANGDDSLRLQTIIAHVTGVVPESRYLQKGLTEAMTNVSNHAYPDDYLSKNLFKKKQWWMSASFNGVTQKLTILFYDQGIGIPESLPRKASESFMKIITLFADDDGKMIEAAIERGRSRTDESHRGNGLEDIKNYISNQNIENGYFKIYSGRGEYHYKKTGDENSENTARRSQKLQGTLIEWQVCIKDKIKNL